MVKPVSIAPASIAIPATTTPIAKTATTANQTTTAGVAPTLISDVAHTILHLLAFQVSTANKATASANLSREFAVLAGLKMTEQEIYTLLYGELFGADANDTIASMVTNMEHVGEKTTLSTDELAIKVRQTFSEIAFCLATGGNYAPLIASL